MIFPPDLSIVIPAYNEEKRILPTLEKVATFIKAQPRSIEVLIVDDGSTDGTADAVRKFCSGKDGFRLLTGLPNVGKGGAVRRGMLEAKGEHRLFSDADLSTPIEEVEKFLAFSDDVIIGSRRVKGCNVVRRQPFFREAAGRVFSLLVRLITLRGFLDTQCGFKMFTAAAAEAVFRRQTIDRFGFDVEILFIAHKLGYRIRECGITWYDSPFTRVRFLRDSTRMFLDLIRIRLNERKGSYA